MNSIEDSVRLELIQLGGVLVLDSPKPGEELVYDSVRYILIDFRDVFGEWQSLARSGESLLIKFGDNTSIKLDHFFNKGVGAPTEVLVQIGDSVVISPDAFFNTYASLEERARLTTARFRAAPGSCQRRWCFRSATTIRVRFSATRTRSCRTIRSPKSPAPTRTRSRSTRPFRRPTRGCRRKHLRRASATSRS